MTGTGTTPSGTHRTVTLGADDLFVDTFSLDDFRLALQGRLDEALAMLVNLTAVSKPESLALGEFEDARQAAGRYRTLHEECVERLSRLTEAMAVAQRMTGEILDRYQSTEDLYTAKVKDIEEALRPLGEVLDGGHRAR
jgi:hypothetical protein